MFKTLLFLTALGLVQARPQVNDDEVQINQKQYEYHEDCPPAEYHFLLPHEYDCAKFYYCEYGLKWIIPRDCPPGTEFSAEIQVCVHPSSSGCTLPGYSTTESDEQATSTAATAAPTNAPTSTAVPTTTTSAPTTAAPTTTTAAPTTTTAATSTTAAPTTTSAAPTTTTVAATTTTVAPTASTLAPTTTVTETTAPPTEGPTEDDCEYLENGCPADFDVHKLLPHEAYCNKFYYCVRGELVERICAAGTWFNPELELCDWPQNVDCANEVYEGDDSDDAGNDENDGNDDSDGNDESDGNDADSESEGEILDNGCPADFDVHKLLPHETECDKFYYCVFGEKVERSCAPGTYFNYEIQVCDWPYNVNCTSSVGDGNENCDGNESCNGDTEDEDNDNDDSETCDGNCDNGDGNDEDNDDTSDGNDAVDFEALPNGCPSDFSIHWLLPHESDCGKFYYCVHGQTVEVSCPTGTHFNPTEQVCDWPHLAGCETSDSCTGCPESGDSEDGSDGSGTETDNDNGNGNDDDDDDEEPDSGNDDTGSGSGSDEGSGDGGNDTDSDDGDTLEPELLPNGCPSNFSVNLLLPHESNCSKFYYCVHGQKVEVSCAAGTHFNPAEQQCDWPHLAGCELGSVDSDGNDENDSDGNDTDEGNDAEDSDGDDDSLIVTENKCKDECNAGPWAHSVDCDKYWICNGLEPVLVTCSEGLHFNPSTNTCDFICNAGCVREDLQATAHVEGVKLFLPWKKIDYHMERFLKLVNSK